MIHGLDLFSGIGGISEGLREWVRPVAYCERDIYAQGVLLSRMQSGDIASAPIWDDVETLTGNMLPKIDIIYGGFPCQDISVAGAGAGLDGGRSGLFFQIVRLVEELRPTFIFLENVPAIRARGLARVCIELATLRYDIRWTIVSAAEIGAPHKRERWFLLAHAHGSDLRNTEGRRSGRISPQSGYNGKKKPMADAEGIRLEAERKPRGTCEELTGPGSACLGRKWWAVEPDVGRVVNGLSNRVDRIKCLGNSVVPHQAKVAFERLMDI